MLLSIVFIENYNYKTPLQHTVLLASSCIILISLNISFAPQKHYLSAVREELVQLV